jgi:Transcriptional regulator
MDRLDGMRLFVRVAELGSFSAVAQQMNVARSIVTRQVAGLEAHLGTEVARAQHAPREPHVGGRDVSGAMPRNPVAGRSRRRRADRKHAGPSGHLRITLSFSFGIRQLMPLFSEFMTAHPGISIELEFSDRRSNLIEGGYDLAIRISNQLDAGDVARKIGSSQSVVAASPDYIARCGAPRHPRELIEHECFGYLLAPRPSWAFVIDGETQWFPIRGRLDANSGEALLAASIRGIGITLAPTFIAENAVREGHLKILLPKFRMPELGIYAVFPGNRYIPHRVRALVEFIAARIGQNPPWDEILKLR